MGHEIKFHPATFYLSISDMLAREVEGIWEDPSDDAPDESPSLPAENSVKSKAEAGVHLVENESGSAETSEQPAAKGEDFGDPKLK